MKTKRLQTVFTVFFAYFSLSAFVRRSKSLIYACLLTWTSTLHLAFPNTKYSVAYTDKAPSIQWRDRAGFSPASILAFCPNTRNSQSLAQKEHKSYFFKIFSRIVYHRNLRWTRLIGSKSPWIFYIFRIWIMKNFKKFSKKGLCISGKDSILYKWCAVVAELADAQD